MRKTYKAACGIVCALGFLVMMGAAGGSDANTISLGQAIRLSLLGLGMFAGGGYMGGFIR